MSDDELREYNEKQKCFMVDLFERERWILGQQLKRDPRDHWADLAILENRVIQIVSNGFGKWMSEQITK